MNIVKKQHFISQFYLKFFSIDEDKIYCISKEKLNYWHSNFEDTAEIKYFYDFRLRKKYEYYNQEMKDAIDVACIKDTGKKYCDLTLEERIELDQKLEHKLGEDVESPLCNIIKQIVNDVSKLNAKSLNDFRFISNGIKDKLSKYLIVQYMRTKSFRDFIVRSEIGFHRFICDNLISKKLDVNITFDKDAQQIMHIHALLDDNEIIKYANAINSHKWVLYINNTKTPFLTNDDPLMIRRPKNLDRLKGCGLKTYGVIICYPLTDKLMLVMFERKEYHNIKDRSCKLINDSEKIDQLNNFIIWNAYEFIYTGDFKMVNFVIEQFKKNPEFSQKRLKSIIYS